MQSMNLPYLVVCKDGRTVPVSVPCGRSDAQIAATAGVNAQDVARVVVVR